MYARIVRFTDVTSERVESLLARINASDGPPEGVPMTAAQLLYDADQGTAISLQFYDSAEDMAEAARVMSAMDPGETPGTRVSVDACEVKADIKL